MAENVYEDLRKLLDRHPSGCPPAPEIIEILKKDNSTHFLLPKDLIEIIEENVGFCPNVG